MRSFLFGFVLFTVPWLSVHSQDNFLLKDEDTIVFIGDSITEAGTKPEGYISLINLFCNVNGYGINSINAGISGDDSYDVLKRINQDAISHNPNWVSISCGVNDVIQQLHPGTHEDMLKRYKSILSGIINSCTKENVKVLLLTPTPVYDDLNSDANKILQGYSSVLNDLAKKNKLIICDLFSAFGKYYENNANNKNPLTYDGIHMLPRGNRLIAQEILTTLGASSSQIHKAEFEWNLINKKQPQ